MTIGGAPSTVKERAERPVRWTRRLQRNTCASAARASEMSSVASRPPSSPRLGTAVYVIRWSPVSTHHGGGRTDRFSPHLVARLAPEEIQARRCVLLYAVPTARAGGRLPPSPPPPPRPLRWAARSAGSLASSSRARARFSAELQLYRPHREVRCGDVLHRRLRDPSSARRTYIASRHRASRYRRPPRPLFVAFACCKASLVTAPS